MYDLFKGTGKESDVDVEEGFRAMSCVFQEFIITTGARALQLRRNRAGARMLVNLVHFLALARYACLCARSTCHCRWQEPASSRPRVRPRHNCCHGAHAVAAAARF